MGIFDSVSSIFSGHGIPSVKAGLEPIFGRNSFVSETLAGGSPGMVGVTSAFNGMTQKPAPMQTPGAQPNQQNATTVALNQQLQNELNMRASRSPYTGSGGLLDDSPNVASRVLLGA